jgi:hypothetical protein
VSSAPSARCGGYWTICVEDGGDFDFGVGAEAAAGPVKIGEAADFAVAEFEDAMISDCCESTRQLTLSARL